MRNREMASMLEGVLLIPGEMKSKYTKTAAAGFTLVELLVTVTILVALAGFTLSMVKRGVIQSKLTASLSQVRAMGPLVHVYSQDHGGRLPVWKDGDVYWWAKIADPEEYDPESLFKSPNDPAFDRNRLDKTISYGWNTAVIDPSTSPEGEEQSAAKMMMGFSQPEKTLILADGAKGGGFGMIEPGGPVPDPERYAGKVAALMLDGSARIMNATQDFQSDSEWFKPEMESSGSEGISHDIF